MFLDELSRILRLRVPADQLVKLAQEETQKIILAEEELERQRIIALHKRYSGSDVLEEKRSVQNFSDEETVDLSVAHKDHKIWDRSGRGLIVTSSNAEPTNTKIAFNGVAEPRYRVRQGGIRADFNEIYLTNTAQPGGKFTFVVALYAESTIDMEASPIASTPHMYSVTMTLADTDYKIEIPAGTKAIYAILTDGAAFSIGVGESTKKTFVPANTPYKKENLDLHPDYTTLYFMSGVESKIATVRAWT